MGGGTPLLFPWCSERGQDCRLTDFAIRARLRDDNSVHLASISVIPLQWRTRALGRSTGRCRRERQRPRDREKERERERERERMCRGEWNVLFPPSFPLTSRRRQSKECWARAPLGEAIMITRSTQRFQFFHNSLGKINQLLEMTDLPKRRFQWRWCPLRLEPASGSEIHGSGSGAYDGVRRGVSERRRRLSSTGP